MHDFFRAVEVVGIGRFDNFTCLVVFHVPSSNYILYGKLHDARWYHYTTVFPCSSTENMVPDFKQCGECKVSV